MSLIHGPLWGNVPDLHQRAVVRVNRRDLQEAAAEEEEDPQHPGAEEEAAGVEEAW